MKSFRNFLFKVNKQQFIAGLFFDLAELLEAGLPLDRALEIIEKENTELPAASTVRKIKHQILSGRPLSAALANNQEIFPEFLSSLMRAAEQSGQLSPILKETARYLENSIRFKSRLRAQLIYPALVLTAAFSVLIFLGFFVLPNFITVFKQNNLRLPFLTRMVFGTFDFSRKFLGWILLSFAGLIIISKNYLKKNADYFFLKLPVASEIIKKISLARFCQTLAVLLNSGTALLEALYISGQTIENKQLRAQFSVIPYWINRGLSFKNSLEKIKNFPERLKQMIALAEETGSLGPTLANAGNYYQNEVEKSFQLLTTLAEPAITLIIGGIVALLVVSVFLPLINLASSLSI